MEEGPAEEYQTEACGNCKALLVGDYCHQCGQQNRNAVRSVFALVGDFFHDIVNWDSRLFRTLRPLMFQPGYLPNEYVVGRRARYVQPVRLYLFISIFFFIVLATATQFDTDALRSGFIAEPTVDAEGNIVPPPKFSERGNFQLNVPFLSDEAHTELVARVDRLAERPDLLLRQLKTLAPQMMFVMLPLFAVILKILYLFAKRYYVEHLVLALHTHSFMFVSFIALFALGGIRGWSQTGLVASWVGTATSVLIGLIWIWIPVYLFLAQKRFYRQGWFFTSVKYLLTGFTYFMLMSFALAGLVLLSIATA